MNSFLIILKVKVVPYLDLEREIKVGFRISVPSHRPLPISPDLSSFANNALKILEKPKILDRALFFEFGNSENSVFWESETFQYPIGFFLSIFAFCIDLIWTDHNFFFLWFYRFFFLGLSMSGGCRKIGPRRGFSLDWALADFTRIPALARSETLPGFGLATVDWT